MGLHLSNEDIFAVLKQMPASILFKRIGSEEVHGSKGFERTFGILKATCIKENSITFFDSQSKQKADDNESPFSRAEAGEPVSCQFRVQTECRAMNCHIESGLINTSVDEWLVLYITPNGNDFVDDNQENSAVVKHIAFNQLLTNFSSKLINANVNELDSIIDQALAAYGEFSDVDRCYLFEFSENIEYMSNTHEWVAAGVTPYIDDLQDMPTTSLPFFISHISNGLFKIDDVSTIPDVGSSEREIFQEQRICSILCVRIMVDETVYGFIGCDIIGSPYSWKAYDIEYLRRIGEMLGNTLQNIHNRKALQKMQLELLKANKQLEQLANIDGLTGIANRRLFDSTLQRDIKRCQKQGLALSLLLIDVDFFKQYNDHYGHVAGDKVLKKIAKTLSKSCLGNDDLVARYGGEEFAVILPGTDSDAVNAIASRILRNVMFLDIPHEYSTHNNKLTVSIGLISQTNDSLKAVYKQHRDQSASWLISQADEALYRAKNAGRNLIKS